jgi:hypothetical protein
MTCNGKRPVRLKTLHGEFYFELQRYLEEGKSFNYFELTNQMSQEYSSQRLQEYVSYYSNRMSYEEVEKLLKRNQGQQVLSDQSIWGIVTREAEIVSEQIAQEVNQILANNPSEFLTANRKLDIYDPQQEEILVFDDGIQVKGQKENRIRNSSTIEKHDQQLEEEVDKANWLNTNIAILQTGSGKFEYLVAPLADEDKSRPQLAEVIKARIIQVYNPMTSPLNIVAITDGAREIRVRLLSIFAEGLVIILDWYHLGKKLRELMSMIARNKQEKSEHLKFLFYNLWRGETQKSLDYLNSQVKARNPKKLEELIGYLEKHRDEIINYQRRQQAGKSIGSGRMEKGVDLVVGHRQKKKGMSWRPLGSRALAILKVVELNGQWQKIWFPNPSAN